MLLYITVSPFSKSYLQKKSSKSLKFYIQSLKRVPFSSFLFFSKVNISVQRAYNGTIYISLRRWIRIKRIPVHAYTCFKIITSSSSRDKNFKQQESKVATLISPFKNYYPGTPFHEKFVGISTSLSHARVARMKSPETSSRCQDSKAARWKIHRDKQRWKRDGGMMVEEVGGGRAVGTSASPLT